MEDDPLVRTVTCRALGAVGYRVLEAASAEDALMSFGSRDAVDVVITDMLPPGMTGRGLAKDLPSRWPSIRVLLVSGYVGDTNVADLESSRGFLQKPYTPDDLLGRTRELIDAAPSGP